MSLFHPYRCVAGAVNLQVVGGRGHIKLSPGEGGGVPHTTRPLEVALTINKVKRSAHPWDKAQVSGNRAVGTEQARE